MNELSEIRPRSGLKNKFKNGGKINMSMRTSLREWAKENKVWVRKTWRIFLEKDLILFYKHTL